MGAIGETIMDAQECFLEEVASHSIFHNERGKYSYYDFFFQIKRQRFKQEKWQNQGGNPGFFIL